MDGEAAKNLILTFLVIYEWESYKYLELEGDKNNFVKGSIFNQFCNNY